MSMLGLQHPDQGMDLFQNPGGKFLETTGVPTLSENIKRGLVDGDASRSHGAVTSIARRNPHTLLLTTSLDQDKPRNKTPLLAKQHKPRSKALKPLYSNSSIEKMKISGEARREALPSKPMLGKVIGHPGSSLANKKFYFLRLCRPPLSGAVRLN